MARINFTPTEKDEHVIGLIQKQKPVSCAERPQALRESLEFWAIYHDPERLAEKRPRGRALDEISKGLREVKEILLELLEK